MPAIAVSSNTMTRKRKQSKKTGDEFKGSLIQPHNKPGRPRNRKPVNYRRVTLMENILCCNSGTKGDAYNLTDGRVRVVWDSGVSDIFKPEETSRYLQYE